VRGEGANRVRFFQPTADDELCHVRYMCFARSKGKRRASECRPMLQIYVSARQILAPPPSVEDNRRAPVIRAQGLGANRRLSCDYEP
jgi:hypothetical protein